MACVTIAIKAFIFAGKGIAAMNAARKIWIISSFFGILTRLYFLSGLAVVTVLAGNISGLLISDSYFHQALGAMIVIGVIWFLALAANAVLSAERGIQSNAAFLSEASGTDASKPVETWVSPK